MRTVILLTNQKVVWYQVTYNYPNVRVQGHSTLTYKVVKGGRASTTLLTSAIRGTETVNNMKVRLCEW